MVNISKLGDSSIKFTFTDNDRYLYNGEITTPLNSLILVLDESDMAVFKKIDGDLFLSFLISNSNFSSKSDLETFYKNNMVGSTGGGGGGGVTPEEVQGMIDESISGKADTSAVTEAISAATDDMATQTWVGEQGYITGVDLSDYATLQDIPDVSDYFDGAEYDSGTTRINFYHGNTVKAYIDASAFIVDGMIDDVRIETISGASYLVIDFNTASGKEDIQIPLTDIFDPSNYYTKAEVDAALSGKADTSAVTASINAAVSGKVDTSSVVTAVTSASTNSEIPTAKAVYDAVGQGGGGGGTTYTAGRAIDITNNTISLDLPISAGTGTNSIIEGDGTIASGDYSHSEGYSTSASGEASHAEGSETQAIEFASHAEGSETQAIEFASHAEGWNTIASGQGSHAEGSLTIASGNSSHAEGQSTQAIADFSHAEGNNTIASGDYSHTEGVSTLANNQSEHASGQFNVSSSASTTFGDSGNTLFSVGNGKAPSKRHNAFEIRQNGDIYFSKDGSDVKLQDSLFSGDYNDLTNKPTIPTSASQLTNDAGYITSDALSGYAESSAVTEEIAAAVSGKVDTTTYTAYTAATDTVLGGKLDATAYTPTDLSDYWTSAQTESAINDAVSGKASQSDLEIVSGDVANKQDTLVSGTNIKTINNQSLLGSGNITIQGGGSGSSTVELTQAEYDALVSGGTVDPTTYYIITDATPIDISNYYTSAQTDSAISAAVSTIQDSLSGYVTTDTEQIISGRKIFTYYGDSSKAIEFKQTNDSAKVGFRVRTSAATNNELASFEFRPNTFTIDGHQHPLLYFGHWRNSNMANAGIPQTVIGFRQYDQLNAAAYHYLMPLPEKAKTPFSLTTSFKDYYAPIGFKNGSTMITAADTGVVDLSSELDGLKLKKLTQAAYDALVSGGTVDSSTLYIITNVVN